MPVTNFLPLAGTEVGNPLSMYLNGMNQAGAIPRDGGGSNPDMGGDDGAMPGPTGPFSPPSFGQLTQQQIKAATPPPPSAKSPEPPEDKPSNVKSPWSKAPSDGSSTATSNRGSRTVTRYDGVTRGMSGQGQNSLLAFLQMLMALQGRQSRLRNRSGVGTREDRTGNPAGEAARRWFNQNYWNPGRTGESNTPGAGAGYGFAGFTRGTNPNPYRNPRVGDTSAMRGGAPNPRESGFSTLARMTGDNSDPHRLSFDRWLSDFFRSQSQPYKQGSNWPLGIPKDARGPGNDAGYQNAWREFFGRGQSLDAMDRALRGEFGGGGGIGMEGATWLV